MADGTTKPCEMKVAELTKQRDGLQHAYDAALRQMNEAIAKAEWLRTDAIAELEHQNSEMRKIIQRAAITYEPMVAKAWLDSHPENAGDVARGANGSPSPANEKP